MIKVFYVFEMLKQWKAFFPIWILDSIDFSDLQKYINDVCLTEKQSTVFYAALLLKC